MARYRQYANESQIKNLTNTTYRVYCTTGGLLTFPPTIYKEDDPPDTKYVCNTGSKDWLEEHGIDRSRLFFASCRGSARDGQLVWIFHPYNVDDPRLVPHRES